MNCCVVSGWSLCSVGAATAGVVIPRSDCVLFLSMTDVAILGTAGAVFLNAVGLGSAGKVLLCTNDLSLAAVISLGSTGVVFLDSASIPVDLSDDSSVPGILGINCGGSVAACEPGSANCMRVDSSNTQACVTLGSLEYTGHTGIYA